MRGSLRVATGGLSTPSGACLNLSQVLFSLGGRLPRLPFWYAVIAIAALLPVAVFVLMMLLGPAPFLVMILMPVLYLAAIWIGFALSAKRLHDRDKSAGWLLLFALLPSLLAQVAHRMVNEPSASLVAAVPAALAAALAFWGFVEVAVLPGTPGPNRFGPDPSAPVPDALD